MQWIAGLAALPWDVLCGIIKIPEAVKNVIGTEDNGKVTLKWDSVKEAKELLTQLEHDKNYCDF